MRNVILQHEKATRDILDHLWKDPDVFRCESVKLEKEDLEFIKELIHKTKDMVSPLVHSLYNEDNEVPRATVSFYSFTFLNRHVDIF